MKRDLKEKMIENWISSYEIILMNLRIIYILIK